MLPNIDNLLYEFILLREASREEDIKKAEDPSTPPNELEELVNDSDLEIASKAAANPNLPQHVILSLAGYNQDSDDLKNRRASAIIDADKRHGILGAVASNPSTPDWLLKHLIDHHADKVIQNPILPLLFLENPNFIDPNRISQQMNLARVSNLNPEVQRILLHNYPNARPEIARLPEMSPEVLSALMRYPDSHQALASNPHLPEKEARELYEKASENERDYKNSSIIHHLMDHPVIGPDIVDSSLRNTRDGAIYHRALDKKNPSLPELLDLIKTNPNMEENGALQNHTLQRIKLHLHNDPSSDIKNHILNKETNPLTVAMLHTLIPKDTSDEYSYSKNGYNPNDPDDHIAHILSMHPDPELRKKAIKHSKNKIDDIINDLDVASSRYNPDWSEMLLKSGRIKPEESKVALQKYLHSRNPILKTYARTHPVVYDRLDSLRQVDPEDREDSYKTTPEGEPYLDQSDFSTSLEPPEDKLSLKFGDYYNPDTEDEEDIIKDVDHVGAEALDAAHIQWHHPKTYNFLAQHKNPTVRELISKNSFTPSETLHYMANDSHKPVRVNVVKHPNTSLNTLNVLRKDNDPEIRELATNAYNSRSVKPRVKKNV